mgnify:CR=1 FL=1
MKNLNNIFLAGTILVFVMTACDKEQTLTLSREDQIALKGMKEAYENSVKANASLKTAIQAGNSTDIRKYDSVFHYYRGNFEVQHGNYTHDGAHDDHLHDGQGMRGMNTMMNNHQLWTDGHHIADHDLMDGLIGDHDSIVH